MKRLDRRLLLQGSALGLLGLGSGLSARPAWPGPEGETLYNGIRLPSPWPPRLQSLPDEPALPPYLAGCPLGPPAVIPIDVGRQLFVDDFLIEKTTLTRVFHAARYHKENPVLKPDKPWELTGQNPTAMVFSDGVWWDPQDRLFKMWYMGGHTASTCYATSRDGIHWEKPLLDVKPGTNIVQAEPRDSIAVWLDLETEDPQQRYKLFRSWRVGTGWGLYVSFSPDGIHWKEVLQSGPCGDRTTAFWNPFRKVWVYSLRSSWGSQVGDRRRARRYWEVRDLLAGPQWQRIDEPTFWAGADRQDAQRDDLKTPCELYNLDGVAYESLILGLFSIWRGQPRVRPKPNEVCLGFSRDGFHWYRPTHTPFIPVSEEYGDWNWGNVQSAGGCCLVVGDQLYFFISGRAGVMGTPQSGMSSTGLATLRRDGFASMNAGEEEGTLTTRPVRFRGKHLFVNVDAPQEGALGALRAEVLDQAGKPIPPFTRANCAPIRAGKTLHPVTWKGARDLAVVAGKPVRFRFFLENGQLYAFWVSPDASGASHGYVAAGGPGFTGPVDVVGAGAKS
jgi:hypothetical protein